VPTGRTSFRFHVADFTFESTDYQWMVIAGARVQYKGSGTVNGIAGYGFMLTAIDGADKWRGWRGQIPDQNLA